MKLGEKIALLLKESGMTKIELSRRLGLKDSSVVSHWVRDRFHPDPGNRRKLAAVFDKPLAYFDDDPGAVSYGASPDETRRVFEASQKKLTDFLAAIEGEEARRIIHVGVIGTVSAENFNIGFENPPTEYLPVLVESSGGKKTFALRVRGSCLEPTAREGDYAIVSQTDWVDEGQLAVLRFDGEFTVKRVYRKDRHVELKPDNPALRTLKIAAQDLCVMGQVI
ncbi:MAG: XRE family transcriptional regulator, partial [Elusimicrobiales bacterium]|nr:XRE family transcriptional regulator [Elusimicrobiales bacterium]